jgi:hypothetical protein
VVWFAKGVEVVIGQSACVASTYLVDLGGGWGAVYHDDLRYIEEPRSLDALRNGDACWQPWRPFRDAQRAEEVMANVEEAVGLRAPAQRTRFQPHAAVQ